MEGRRCKTRVTHTYTARKSEQLKLAQANPQMHNTYEAYRRMYSALGVDNIEQILTPPQQPQPTNAITENGQLQMALVGKQQLKAFPEQNHNAHIQTHLAFMQSMTVKGNPAALQILQTHIFEHLSLKGQIVAQQEMQAMQQQGQEIPPEMMQNRSDAFITMPGGIGTMEELFEILTWLQLGLHSKPIGLLNVNHYYDDLIVMLQKMVEKGFLSKDNLKLLIVDDQIDTLLEKMRNFKAPQKPKLLTNE